MTPFHRFLRSSKKNITRESGSDLTPPRHHPGARLAPIVIVEPEGTFDASAPIRTSMAAPHRSSEQGTPGARAAVRSKGWPQTISHWMPVVRAYQLRHQAWDITRTNQNQEMQIRIIACRCCAEVLRYNKYWRKFAQQTNIDYTPFRRAGSAMELSGLEFWHIHAHWLTLKIHIFTLSSLLISILDHKQHVFLLLSLTRKQTLIPTQPRSVSAVWNQPTNSIPMRFRQVGAPEAVQSISSDRPNLASKRS